ncbi:MAG TPA: aspartate carbamoyltransferase catalytic subunit, partial [Gammaproteobacteria bacterium]
ITALLDRAQAFVARPGETAKTSDTLRGITVANLFFEASTRTRASFEIAARRLGANVLNLDINVSSAAKGETVLDTVHTLEAMNVDAFVVRHAETGVQEMIAGNVAPHIAVINAGESHANHPTQGLLDALTIRQHKPDFEKLRVAIVGDIRHSRVARSAVHALTALGVTDLRLVAPKALLPADEELNGTHFTGMDDGIRDCDVVMMLRIQKERMQAGNVPDFAEYHRLFGMDERRLDLVQPDAIVMHPGPVNRGVEISDAVADGPQSVILEQVNNGVAARMAVLATLMENRPA